jgi:hypothetical protein
MNTLRSLFTDNSNYVKHANPMPAKLNVAKNANASMAVEPIKVNVVKADPPAVQGGGKAAKKKQVVKAKASKNKNKNKLEDRTVADLAKRAQKLNIAGRSKMGKEALVKAIRKRNQK